MGVKGGEEGEEWTCEDTGCERWDGTGEGYASDTVCSACGGLGERRRDDNDL